MDCGAGADTCFCVSMGQNKPDQYSLAVPKISSPEVLLRLKQHPMWKEFDRVGYEKFKKIILEGVELNPECLVAEHIYWHETEYRSNINVKKIEAHQTVDL